MSKAFTSEETPDEPLFVRRRAPLPEGVANYVTRRGLAALQHELQELERERGALLAGIGDQGERARASGSIQLRVNDLESRIASAELVEPYPAGTEQVRFGARVTVRDGDDVEHVYSLVGVDEADAQRGLIAFTAPLARALLGKRVGDTVTLRTPRSEQELELLVIDYDMD